MYSDLKNIQILVALLKKYDVKHVVISAGTRHTPFVCSVEYDDFFQTYSVVDERSASFFAIGLIEKLREPVAVVCTSGTAAANYVSAANEAFYQQLPLLLLTADRNHYYMFQQEEQMIPQEGLYKSVCKKTVTLGHVRDDKDFWYVSRICNEALLELRQGELGPVHINFIVENDYPINQGIVKFQQSSLPDVRKIERLTLEDNEDVWKSWADKLKNSKILIVYGQYGVLKTNEKNILEQFIKKYNCVISKDLIANLHVDCAIPTFMLCRALSYQELNELKPDVLITMNANTISEIKIRMEVFKEKYVHWHVSSKGEISDPFKCLPNVIKCSPQVFFKRFSELTDESNVEHSYYEQWKNCYLRIGNNGSLKDVDIPYSSMYTMQQFMKRIPDNSLLHIANSNSIRLANYFDVNESIEVYGNRGTHGIDGSMSAFIGQAYVKDGLAFLIIGDLSFFYDMNALWNQYVGNNIRILVCNNSGGAIFYSYPNTNNVPSLDEHIAAAHYNSVRGWVEDRGFLYLSADSKEELDSEIEKFMCLVSDKPIVLEVFTDKEIDANCIKTILKPYIREEQSFKHKIGKIMPHRMKEVIKKVIN